MQKNNVNVVVFDQDQSFVTQQSRVNYSTARRANTQDAFGASQAQSVINIQIGQLNQKINALQQKAIQIQQAIKTVNTNNSMTDINASVNTASANSSQIEQLLRVVQTKIQVVVQETKKIIERMTSEFDKKISKVSAQKNHQANSIAKIQTHCRDTIAKVQQSYQQQLNLIRNQHAHLEKRLIQRVDQIQNDYRKKLKDFQSKEQQYVATIGHLQNKLKQMSKSKKTIQVTQDRPTSSVRTQAHQNSVNMSSHHIGSSNALPSMHDTSKRRTRIFQSNRSVSPNNQVLSPLKSQQNIKKQNASITKPQQQQHEQYRTSKTNEQKPMPNNLIGQAKTAYNQLKPKHEQNVNIYYTNPNPIANVPTTTSKIVPANPIQTQNAPNLPQPNKNVYGKPQQLLREASQKQFLKDVPKVQWERFQDFNENDGSGSDEDVFFYTQQNKQPDPKTAFNNTHNDSDMHSPFDIN